MSTNLIWVLIGLLVPFLVAATNPLQDDIWWTLKLGELLAAGRSVAAEDVLTFPPHAAGYLNAQWLSQLWYYGISRTLGLEGVVLANAVQVTAAFGLVLHLAWQRCRDLRVAALCTLAGSMAAATNLNPRAQTVGLLLFAGNLWLLHARGRGLWRLPALAALAALWANVHGSFWLAPLLALLAMPGGRVRFLALAVGLECLAFVANPHGLEIIRYVGSVVTNPTIRSAITEWQPPTVGELSTGAFFASLAFTALLTLRGRSPIRVPDLLLIAAFAILGLLAVRNLVWWGVAIPPIWAGSITAAPAVRPEWPGRRQYHYVNAAFTLLLAAFMVGCLPWVKAHNPLLPAARRALIAEDQPVGAADHLAAQGLLPSRIFAFQPWAGYLEWRLWPDHQLMVDGRIELRPGSVWEDYALASAGDLSWQARLDKYGISVLVISRRAQGELLGRVEQTPGWTRLYEDALAAIYSRSAS